MIGLVPLGASPPPRDPGPLARAILAQPQFRLHVQPAPARTWWDIVKVWLRDRWTQLMDELSRHVRLSSRASVALGDIILVLLILLVVIVVVRLLLNMARETAQPRLGASPLPTRDDAAALYAAARQAAGQRSYASAITLLFRAALASLDARGVLRDDPARTVNECRADVRRNAAGWAPAFEVIAGVFTLAVYAEQRVTAEDWTEAQRAYEAFLRPQTDVA